MKIAAIVIGIIGIGWAIALTSWLLTGRKRGLSINEWMDALIRTKDTIQANPALEREVVFEHWLKKTYRPKTRVRVVDNYGELTPGTRGVIAAVSGMTILIRWENVPRGEWFVLDPEVPSWLGAEDPPE